MRVLASILILGLIYPGYSQTFPEMDKMVVNEITAYRNNVQPPATNMKNIVSACMMKTIIIKQKDKLL